MKRSLLTLAVILAAGVAATPASAQLGGRVSIMPYVGYGFLGSLPGTSAELESDIAFGGRASYQLSPQFAVYGNFQRTTPAVTGTVGGIEVDNGEVDLDHWSAGVEFSYVPRGAGTGLSGGALADDGGLLGMVRVKGVLRGE